jgi:alpha-L-fucosidase 2
MRSILFLFSIFGLLFCQTQNQKYLLWYDQPAQEWEEAMPTGNGRIGAMVFGKPDVERIQLNDDSMWPGSGDDWENPPGRPQDLKKIRELIIRGKNTEADALLVEKFSRKGIGRSHQTLGELFIELNHENISDYRRELDLNNAIINVSYKSNGNLITERVFTSAPDQAIIIEFKSESASGLNGKIRLTRPYDNGHPTAQTKAFTNTLIMQGEVTQRGGWFDSKEYPILHGVKFETRLLVKSETGTVKNNGEFLELQGVKKATLYLVNNTSFYHKNFRQVSENQLHALKDKSFEVLLSDHRRDYQSYFNRVDLKLTAQSPDSMTTDNRLQQVKKGEVDLGLQALLFQYGRYLLISCSRPGSNPANLQGLWNQHIMAPWNNDYHLNINLQMNYWPADVTNLSELNQPLFDYIDRALEQGKTTARQNWGTRGSFLPHATDLWVPTFLQASTAYWGCSFGAGGWMLHHYWQYYLFNRDKIFLRERVYPALHQTTLFYFDWLREDPRDNSLVAFPSTSPENQYIHPNGDTVSTCAGSAMDQQIIAEVFDNYIQTCKILNIENSFLDSLKIKRSQLRTGLVIGNDGRILEWDREYAEFEKGHRHMSHLYAFHPGISVSKWQTPQLFEAARKTLDYRLAHGGAGTGWSRAWLINLSARLNEGDMAQEHIQLFLSRSMYKNLFDSHPPFQIDGNFGYTAGIAEMLLQSHEENTIRLLPALPSSWKEGYIKGLKARGNFIVDMEWKNNRLLKGVITALRKATVKVIYNDQEFPVDLNVGEKYTIETEIRRQ